MPAFDLTLTAADGRALAATAFEPDQTRASLVILGALGVPRSYYRHVGAFLADRGVAVLTIDYRGVGGSRLASQRHDPATLLDWARLDAPAALDLARTRWPDAPLWALGHSFGGQALGLVPNGEVLAGAIVVAAASGDMAIYPRRLGWKYLFQLGIAAPVVMAIFGYLPGRFGVGADVPAGVIRQWTRWCRTPDYVRGALGRDGTSHHRLAIPIHFFDVSDDTFAPEGPSAALRAWYSAAAVSHVRLTPTDFGAPAVGHFGVFRPGLAEPLWERLFAIVSQGAATQAGSGAETES
jgi:predicted alpha/beta hydrolase